MAQDPNPVQIKITSDADVSAIEKATKATDELTASQEKLNKAAEAGGSSGANPFTDGSQLRDSKRTAASEEITSTRQIQARTEAIAEQAEALEELSDAEAGVVRSTGRLNEEARKPDGFKQLFDQQRLKGIGEEVGKLGKAFGDFAVEFMKTERGQEIMSGLSDETKAFGGVAASVAAAAAQGFAQGGPIGAGIAGLTALVTKFADEWLDANKRIEASNKEREKFEDEHAKAATQRRRDAIEREVEKAYKRELDVLEDQTEELREQKGLRDAMADRDREAFDLNQAKDKAAGKDPSQLRKDKIAFQRDEELKRLDAEEAAAQRERYEAQVRLLIAKNKRDRLAPLGTKSDEFKDADKDFKEAEEALADANRNIVPRTRVIDTRREGARLRAQRELLEEEEQEKERQAREKQRRDDQAAREKERAEKDAERDAASRRSGRDQAGREGESAADQAARLAGKNARAAAAFEKLGNDLAKGPTLDGLDRLIDGIEKMGEAAGDKNSAEARRWRELADRVKRIEEKFKRGGDGK